MRRWAAVALVVAAVGLIAAPALARTHQASIGNYWYEHDEQKDRTRIVVTAGDQITFTVREGVYPPHSVNVDELDIHSPELLLGETYTTPALRKTGTFRLYCRAHEDRGHVTRLVIRAPPRATSAPATATARRPSAARAASAPSPTAAVVSPTPSATLTPVGVGKASKADLAQRVRRDPNSLEALTGRGRSTAPWTRSLWWLLIASVPIVGAAALALARERRTTAATAGVLPPRPAGVSDADWRTSFRRRIERRPELKSASDIAATVALLARVPAFSRLEYDQVDQLARTAYPIAFEPGDVLADAAADPPEYYVVTEGEASVKTGGRETTRVGPDDVVDARGLLDGARRAATVTAETHMLTYAISRERLERILRPKKATKRRKREPRAKKR